MDLGLTHPEEPSGEESERSPSPERSVWDLVGKNPKRMSAYSQIKWTREEIQVLCNLKNKGEKVPLAQIQNKHLPHRKLGSIRNQWARLRNGLIPG